MTTIKAGYILIIALMISVFGCTDSKSFATILITEQNGLPRNLEYVSADIILERTLGPTEHMVVVDANTFTPVQITDTIKNGNRRMVRIVFPVTINANETKELHLKVHAKTADSISNDLHLSRTAHFVENEYYRANFAINGDARGGQVSNLILKKFDGQVLKRGHIPMHWAPNFSKSDSGSYFTMEHLTSSSINRVQDDGPYQITKIRSGVTDSVPEIYVEGEYTFYAGLPYFVFTSTMTVKEDVELNLLRNDEMTMDSLFTDLVFARPNGTVANLKLYGTELELLQKEQIPDEAPWLAFYHKASRYGLGSIRLAYDNINSNGEPSPTHKPYTKITKSSGNGRYWNRILVADTNLRIPRGSSYHEKNAYLMFNVDSEPENKIKYYSERLNHPLITTVEKNK